MLDSGGLEGAIRGVGPGAVHLDVPVEALGADPYDQMMDQMEALGGHSIYATTGGHLIDADCMPSFVRNVRTPDKIRPAEPQFHSSLS